MDRAIMIFCGASLAASLLISILFVPASRVSTDRLQKSRVATPAYELDDVDMGEFGRVPVQELVDYYIDNPPVKSVGEVVSSKARFQGC